MGKHRFTKFVLIFQFAIALCHSAFGSQPPPAVFVAATNGLSRFLSEVSTARLGQPVLLHEIKPVALSTNQTPQKFVHFASETTMWFFPVLNEDGTADAMLLVDWIGGEWKAVSYGYAPLAKEWHLVTAEWSSEKGFHPKLVKSSPTSRYYFTVPEIDDRNLTRIVSATTKETSDASLLPAAKGTTSTNRYSKLGSLVSEIVELQSASSRTQPLLKSNQSQ